MQDDCIRYLKTGQAKHKSSLKFHYQRSLYLSGSGNSQHYIASGTENCWGIFQPALNVNLTQWEWKDGYRTGSLISVQDTRNCHQISQSTYSLLRSRGQMGRKFQRAGEHTPESRIKEREGGVVHQPAVWASSVNNIQCCCSHMGPRLWDKTNLIQFWRMDFFFFHVWLVCFSPVWCSICDLPGYSSCLIILMSLARDPSLTRDLWWW